MKCYWLILSASLIGSPLLADAQSLDPAVKPRDVGPVGTVSPGVNAINPKINLAVSANANATEEAQSVQQAKLRLETAIHNPEYVLTHWIDLPTAPAAQHKKTLKLSLKEAILLALRYNPNIQNAELDRILQRYQLRLAQNEFELQYALAGSGSIEKNHYENVGSQNTHSAMASPEFHYKNKLGGQTSLNLTNNVNAYNSYTPVLNLSITQPLLKGFGTTVNTANLLNAEDNEALNKINLKQAMIDQVTQVINAYRNLILSGNNLENQRRQLDEANNSYKINEKKINAGQLEPTANIQQSYQIESLNLMVLQAENEFQSAALDLIQSIGLDPSMHIAVPNDLTLEKMTVPNESEVLKIALANNADYLARRLLIRADERAVETAKNQQRWQLDIGANVQTGMVTNVDKNNNNLSGIYNGRNINESATLTLTVPIHDLGTRNELINAKIRLEKDRLNLIAAKRALITRIKNTVNNISNLAKRYELAEKQVALAQQSYELEKKKQQAGIASALDVNNTQNQLIQAQMGLIHSKVAYLNQRSSLEQLLGTTLENWQIKMRFSG